MTFRVSNRTDWLLLFVTTPLVLALLVFPFTWGSGLAHMFEGFGATLPSATEGLLRGTLTSVWTAVGLVLLGVACFAPMAAGVRRTLLVVALAWATLGFAVTWFAIYAPLFGTGVAVIG